MIRLFTALLLLLATDAEARRKPRNTTIVEKTVPEPEIKLVKTIRIIPLPSKLIPSFNDVWIERVGWLGK